MKILIALFLSSILSSAFAHDFYASAIFENSQSKNSGDGITASGNANGFMIGCDVNEYLAVEAGYNSLFNSARLNGTVGNDAYSDLTGFEFATLGLYPINKEFSVFVRLGYGIYSSNSDWSQSKPTTTGYIATTTSSPTGMIYGPGIKYTVNKDLNFKMGYNIYNLNGTGVNTVAGGINSSSNVNGDILIYNIYISVTSHF